MPESLLDELPAIGQLQCTIHTVIFTFWKRGLCNCLHHKKGHKKISSKKILVVPSSFVLSADHKLTCIRIHARSVKKVMLIKFHIKPLKIPGNWLFSNFFMTSPLKMLFNYFIALCLHHICLFKIPSTTLEVFHVCTLHPFLSLLSFRCLLNSLSQWDKVNIEIDIVMRAWSYLRWIFVNNLWFN